MVAGVGSFGASAQSQTARAGLTDNFDTFLTLLTTQLQNQDPLSPIDSTEFTTQLVQFSGVEQQIRMNDQLEALFGLQQSSFAASMASYLDRDVLLDASTVTYDGSTPIELRYRVDPSATDATLTVRDSSNRIVYQGALPTGQGELPFTFEGERTDGTTLPAGAYSFSFGARNIAGESVTSGGAVFARVLGLDFSGASPAVTTSAGSFGVERIMRVSTRV
jgi:flagellar basal-body rod modification protein FlgD